jgi:hypothetical protein
MGKPTKGDGGEAQASPSFIRITDEEFLDLLDTFKNLPDEKCPKLVQEARNQARQLMKEDEELASSTKTHARLKADHLNLLLARLTITDELARLAEPLRKLLPLDQAVREAHADEGMDPAEVMDREVAFEAAAVYAWYAVKPILEDQLSRGLIRPRAAS